MNWKKTFTAVLLSASLVSSSAVTVLAEQAPAVIKKLYRILRGLQVTCKLN